MGHRAGSRPPLWGWKGSHWESGHARGCSERVTRAMSSPDGGMRQGQEPGRWCCGSQGELVWRRARQGRGGQHSLPRVHLEALLGSGGAELAWRPAAHEAGRRPSQRAPERLPPRHPEGHRAHLRAGAGVVSRPSSPSADPSERKGVQAGSGGRKGPLRPHTQAAALNNNRWTPVPAGPLAQRGGPPGAAGPPRGPGAQGGSDRKSTRR